jgi:PIN domain nuclease of toxin-antitoxin system
VKFLLDTHLLLWVAGTFAGPASPMPAAADALIDDQSNTLYFSPASIWEVAIKSAQGRTDFRTDPHVLRRSLLDNAYLELPITGEHAAGVALLPPIHKDPFDRLLIAQAVAEGLMLLTADAKVAAYGGPIRQV